MKELGQQAPEMHQEAFIAFQQRLIGVLAAIAPAGQQVTSGRILSTDLAQRFNELFGRDLPDDTPVRELRTIPNPKKIRVGIPLAEHNALFQLSKQIDSGFLNQYNKGIIRLYRKADLVTVREVREVDQNPSARVLPVYRDSIVFFRQALRQAS